MIDFCEQDDWWKDLKVGDEVCDCSYIHQKIVSLKKDYIENYIPMWYFWIPDWIDRYIPEWLDDYLWQLQTMFPAHKVWVDTTLTLENRTSCSAKHCCDPVDHNYVHNCRS